MAIPVIAPKKIGLSGITIPKNIKKEPSTPSEQLTFNTDKYGELVVTGIGSEFNTGDKLSGITLKTNQGDFLFVSNSFIDKGYLHNLDVPGKEKSDVQYYSKAFVGDQRDEIFNSAVGVDLSDIPEKATGSNGREALYGITGGDNDDLSRLISKQGFLIPQDVVDSTNLKVTSYKVTDTKGAITGVASTASLPYDGRSKIGADFVYATDAGPAATRGTAALYYLDPSLGRPNTYAVWQDSGGGMFKSVFGNNILGNTLQGISDGLANVEDIAREGIEGVDAALQNPYIKAAIKVVAAVSPDPVTKLVAAGLDAYSTVDSGDDLSAGQIANLAIAGNNVFGTTTSVGGDVGTGVEGGASVDAGAGAGLDLGGATGLEMDADLALGDVFQSELKKLVEVGAAFIDDADPLQTVIGAYGNDIASGVTNVIGSVEGGEKIAQVLKDNPEITQTVLDVSTGTDVSEALANNFGDKVASELGAETTNEVALVKGGLETAVGLDQGKDIGDAVFDGAKKSYEEGFRPDIDIDVTGGLDIDIDTSILSGLENAVVAAGDVLAGAAGPAKEGLIAAGDVLADIPVDLDPLDLAQQASEGIAKVSDIVSEGAAKAADVVSDTAAYVEDVISDAIPSTDLGLEGIGTTPDFGIDLPDVNLDIPEVAVDLPEVGVDLPDIQKPTLDLLDFSGLLGGLGISLGALEGKKTTPAGFIGNGNYQTQFNFLQNVEPLGTLGMLSGRNKT